MPTNTSASRAQENDSKSALCGSCWRPGFGPTGNVRPLRPPNDQNGALANTSFGGPHTGVCQFVFCDGSVKAIPTSVSLQTLTYLITRNDGQVLANDY